VFYPAALPGSQQVTAFAVSNVSDMAATVTLSDINGQVDQAMVQPGTVHVFQDTGTHKMSATTQVNSHGYVIESDQVLQVYQFMPPDAPPTADASIVLPEVALGERHRVVTYNTHANNTQQYAAVIATEDDTEVTFTLAQPGSEVLAGGPVPTLDFDMGDDTAMVTLDRLEALVLVGNPEHSVSMELNEFTGSLVETNKPVAVYSGKQLANIPEGECCADLIATSVPPTTVYGTEYAGVKLLPVGMEYDIWRIIGNKDGTQVTLTGGVDDVIDLDEGEFHDIETAEIFWMKSNHPFGVSHFMTAGWLAAPQPPLQPYDCPDPIGAPGDPALSWVYPRGNWLHKYLLRTGTGGQWCHDHMTVVAPTDAWANVTLDGDPLPAPTPVADSGFSYAWVPAPEDFHFLEAPETVPVQVEVYGYVNNGSYYYPGGMGLQALNPEG
jgi:hypothetical protein